MIREVVELADIAVVAVTAQECSGFLHDFNLAVVIDGCSGTAGANSGNSSSAGNGRLCDKAEDGWGGRSDRRSVRHVRSSKLDFRGAGTKSRDELPGVVLQQQC